MPTSVYSEQEIAKAQQLFQEAAPAITRELDIQREQLPETYAGIPFFLRAVQDGRLISDGPVVTPDEMHTFYGFPGEVICGNYFGTTNFFHAIRASKAWIKNRHLYHGIPLNPQQPFVAPHAPIEQFIYECHLIEYRRSDEHTTATPIPAENPALQLLVELLKTHFESYQEKQAMISTKGIEEGMPRQDLHQRF